MALMYVCGMFPAIDYEPSVLVGKEGAIASKQEVASNCKVGMRFKSHQVVRHSEGLPIHIGDFLTSDLRFRILLFAGNATSSAQMKRIRAFADYLDGEGSVISKYTAEGEGRDALIETITIHANSRDEVEMADFPSALFPPYDYNKIYADCESFHNGHGEVYKNLGIDRERGAAIVVRPDGCKFERLKGLPVRLVCADVATTADTALVCDLEDTDKLDAYFGGVLVQPKKPLGAAPESIKDWATVDGASSEGLAAEPVPAKSTDTAGAL